MSKKSFCFGFVFFSPTELKDEYKNVPYFWGEVFL